MAKNQAYLAIEDTFASVVLPDVRKAVKDLQKTVKKALKEKDYTEARRLVGRFDLIGVVSDRWKKLRFYGLTAMVFGQQQFVLEKDTALTTGKMPIPPHLNIALEQYKVLIEQNLSDAVRKEFNAKITEEILADPVELLSKADISIIADDFVESFADAGVSVRANLITSRLASLGFLSEATILNVTTYQVSEVLDSHTCGVCEYMHGKTFKVSTEMQRLDTALRTLDPNELKSLAPWPANTKAGLEKLHTMNPDDMQAEGYGSPPFHPMCRGILVEAGSVTETIETKTPVQEPEVGNTSVYVPEVGPAPSSGGVIDFSEGTQVISLWTRAYLGRPDVQAAFPPGVIESMSLEVSLKALSKFFTPEEVRDFMEQDVPR